jgi:hypothetical protein
MAGETRFVPGVAQMLRSPSRALTYGPRGPEILDLNTGVRAVLADELPPDLATSISRPWVAGSGDVFAFDSYVRATDSEYRLYVFNRLTKALIDVGPYGVAVLSDDASAVFFFGGEGRLGRRGTLQFYTSRLPNGAVENALLGPDGTEPREKPFEQIVSSNGRAVAFGNVFADRVGIYFRDLDAKRTTLLLQAPIDSSRPRLLALSDDGRTIVASYANALDLRESKTFLIDTETGARQPLVATPGFHITQKPVFSGDGKSMMYLESEIVGNPYTLASLERDQAAGVRPATIAEPGKQRIVILDRASGRSVSVVLQGEVTGEVYELENLFASTDLTMLSICGTVFGDSLAKLQPPVTTTTVYYGAPKIRGRDVERRCFLHRVS